MRTTPSLRVQQLARAGDLDAFLHARVGLHLRHLCLHVWIEVFGATPRLLRRCSLLLFLAMSLLEFTISLMLGVAHFSSLGLCGLDLCLRFGLLLKRTKHQRHVSSVLTRIGLDETQVLDVGGKTLQQPVPEFGAMLFASAEHDRDLDPVSYTHLRAHETVLDLVCRLL